LSRTVSVPSVDTLRAAGCVLEKETRAAMSTHDAYAPLATSLCRSPLEYCTSTCVATVAPDSMLLESTLGTDHEIPLAVSTCWSCTVRSALAVVWVPKLAVIVDEPADTACIRVLPVEDTYTTAGAELTKLLWLVTM